jgi:hypothetical protein
VSRLDFGAVLALYAGEETTGSAANGRRKSGPPAE